MKRDTESARPRALTGSPLFAGLSPAELEFALELLVAREACYARGEFIHHAGTPLSSFGLVLAGSVEVSCDDLSGNQMMMTTVSEGETFGESLSYLAVGEAPVYVRAVEDCRILWLRGDVLRRIGPAADPRAHALLHRFVATLAERALSMNDRIQVLSKHTLREKLNTYFAFCARRAGSHTFTLPFDRAGLARYLGVDRTALSRELSRMAREGAIEFYRSSFRLLPGDKK